MDMVSLNGEIFHSMVKNINDFPLRYDNLIIVAAAENGYRKWVNIYRKRRTNHAYVVGTQ